MSIPFTGLKVVVPKEWIDVNGHMNATHYGLVVYDAHFNFTEAIGLGEEYVKSTNCGKAVLESHMIYEREVSEGDELEIKSWLLAVDQKRLHFFHEVYNKTRVCRAAVSEQVDIHIDLVARRSSEIPQELYCRLQDIVRGNLALPTPSGVGSNIKPPKNKWLGGA
ncbi:thioesterase [Parahaliea maris]|uniref:Thioesterase n=1 Tax=Parahaliea maris TaxID=2716870 RepID=A0A5C9A9A6_9GAMM|nr:thioesterase family protein [Parahaliea maris]TXS95831.1 thioesterase [Parahaliea maris]